MMTVRPILSGGRLLVAAATLAAAAPAARADLSFTFAQTGGPTLSGPPNMGASYSFGGYTLTNFAATATPIAPSSGGGENVKFTGTLTKTPGTASSGTFNYDVKFTNVTVPDAGTGTLDVTGKLDGSALGTGNRPLSSSFTITGSVTSDADGGYATSSPSPTHGRGLSFPAVAATFTPTAALPEPTGLLAGLMGLPCVGGVLALARRKLTSVVA